MITPSMTPAINAGWHTVISQYRSIMAKLPDVKGQDFTAKVLISHRSKVVKCFDGGYFFSRIWNWMKWRYELVVVFYAQSTMAVISGRQLNERIWGLGPLFLPSNFRPNDAVLIHHKINKGQNIKKNNNTSTKTKVQQKRKVTKCSTGKRFETGFKISERTWPDHRRARRLVCFQWKNDFVVRDLCKIPAKVWLPTSWTNVVQSGCVMFLPV